MPESWNQEFLMTLWWLPSLKRQELWPLWSSSTLSMTAPVAPWNQRPSR